MGTTYAWWSASSQMETKITMGNLSVTASLDEVTDSDGWEPGLYSELTGTIENTGSIDALVKVSNASTVKFADSEEFVAADPEAVTLNLKPTEDGTFWFKDAAGEAYVLLMPGDVATVAGGVTFVGEKMGNDYMNAQIQVAGEVTASQALDGASLANFGVAFADLTDYFAEETESAGARRSVRTLSPSMKKLQEVMTRGSK
ncbi:MAG TPA: signal peptide protein [Candidatus Enterococcus stercoravium]|nr:signal peptide protein [Candidatus Enterococcus stercoravium]